MFDKERYEQRSHTARDVPARVHDAGGRAGIATGEGDGRGPERSDTARLVSIVHQHGAS